jgi:hypothetical protein
MSRQSALYIDVIVCGYWSTRSLGAVPLLVPAGSDEVDGAPHAAASEMTAPAQTNPVIVFRIIVMFSQ